MGFTYTNHHDYWEILIAGRNAPVIASAYLKETLIASDDISAALIKFKTAHHTNEPYIRCSHCSSPLHLSYMRHENGQMTLFFKHAAKSEAQKLSELKCPFYQGNQSSLLSQIYKGEGKWHFDTKNLVAEILRNSNHVISRTVQVERYLFSNDPVLNLKRRPDIYFEDTEGNSWVVELTRWWMSPVIAAARQQFYQDRNIRILWLFSPDCPIQNAATFNLIKYGLPAKFESIASIHPTKMQCNAFIFDSQAIEQSSKRATLCVEVDYSEFYFDKSRGICERLAETIMPFHELHYEDGVLWGIDTNESYQSANKLMTEYHAKIRVNSIRHLIYLRSILHQYLRSKCKLKPYNFPNSNQLFHEIPFHIPIGTSLFSKAQSMVRRIEKCQLSIAQRAGRLTSVKRLRCRLQQLSKTQITQLSQYQLNQLKSELADYTNPNFDSKDAFEYAKVKFIYTSGALYERLLRELTNRRLSKIGFEDDLKSKYSNFFHWAQAYKFSDQTALQVALSDWKFDARANAHISDNLRDFIVIGLRETEEIAFTGIFNRQFPQLSARYDPGAMYKEELLQVGNILLVSSSLVQITLIEMLQRFASTIAIYIQDEDIQNTHFSTWPDIRAHVRSSKGQSTVRALRCIAVICDICKQCQGKVAKQQNDYLLEIINENKTLIYLYDSILPYIYNSSAIQRE